VDLGNAVAGASSEMSSVAELETVASCIYWADMVACKSREPDEQAAEAIKVRIKAIVILKELFMVNPQSSCGKMASLLGSSIITTITGYM
jgi:hypothetical protein